MRERGDNETRIGERFGGVGMSAEEPAIAMTISGRWLPTTAALAATVCALRPS